MENITRIIEIIYMLLIIIDYVRIFLDWYVDHRIDKKDGENKNRRSCKNERS